MEISRYWKEILQVRPFDTYDKEVLEDMLSEGFYEIRSIGRQEIIYLQEETCCTVDLILKGRVSVERLEESGNILRVQDFLKGDLLGADLAFSRKPYYPMNLVAKENVLLLRIGRKLILRLCQENEDFLSGYFSTISDKTQMLTDKIGVLIRPGLRRKLLDYLNQEIAKQGKRTIRIDGTKKQLAEKLGVQRTSLSRELQKMREEGIISFDQNEFTLL